MRLRLNRVNEINLKIKKTSITFTSQGQQSNMLNLGGDSDSEVEEEALSQDASIAAQCEHVVRAHKAHPWPCSYLCSRQTALCVCLQ